MSEKETYYPTRADAKAAGCFSRRHRMSETSKAAGMQRAARLTRLSVACELRIEEAAARSPQEQLALLDERLGHGIGAEKERRRLKLRIEAAAAAEAAAVERAKKALAIKINKS